MTSTIRCPLHEGARSNMKTISAKDPQTNLEGVTLPQPNPLMKRGIKVPFDEIKPEHIEPAIHQLIEAAQQRLESIIKCERPRTYENTMEPLEELTRDLSFAYTIAGHLESVATHPALREAYNAVSEPVSDFYTSVLLSEGLWAAIREYAQSEDAKRLEGVRKRALGINLDTFRRYGADLDVTGKAKLADINRRLTTLTDRFSQNVVDATDAFEYIVTDPAYLAGLPESAIAASKASAESKDVEGWRFTLHYPSYTAVMTHLDNAEIREAIYKAHSACGTQGETDNRGLLQEILNLRKEKAQILGYQTFAELVLERRMAKSASRALAFQEEILAKVKPVARAEAEALSAFARFQFGIEDLRPWDIAYYAEKQRKALFDFDDEDLREYFPVERVLGGLFEIAQRNYGVRIFQTDELPVWHPDVRTYAVDDSDGTRLGYFYIDLFPRDGKEGGAWMTSFIVGRPLEGGDFDPHLGSISGDVTSPLPDRTSLLTHEDVETLSHEFGHAMHLMLSRVEIPSLGGTEGAADFSELPSQIMENWCWEREALNLFSGHYLTGEEMPEELFEKLLRARNFRSASGMLRQIGYGLMDLKLHTEYDFDRDGSATEYGRGALRECYLDGLPEYHTVTSFIHIFGDPTGYAAAYYSYLWAEALDADAFSKFREEGIFNHETGMEFRRAILERGDSKEPSELFFDFMGRDLDHAAMLRRKGILE